MTDPVKVGHPDRCPDCGGLLINFYNKDDKRISSCPRLCIKCDSLWIDGGKIQLAADWREQFPNVAEEARKKAEEEVERAKNDNDFRARNYFERVFYFAFAEGFLRAVAYFKHKYKDGRFRRIRALWDKIIMEEHGGWCILTGLTTQEFSELTTLINLGRKSSEGQPPSQQLQTPKQD